jgi:hypothetical protein
LSPPSCSPPPGARPSCCADAIDNCPGIYNPAQDDGDSDHAGEACDPHPGTPGDTIVARAMFDVSLIGGSWVPSNAAVWTFANGAAVNTADLRPVPPGRARRPHGGHHAADDPADRPGGVHLHARPAADRSLHDRTRAEQRDDRLRLGLRVALAYIVAYQFVP